MERTGLSKRQVGDSAEFFVHESSYVDEGAVVGAGTRIWHFCHIQSGARIGERCTLGQNVNVAGSAVVGNDCKIQNNVSVYDGVVLGDDVFCGPSCVFTNDLEPRARCEAGWEVRDTVVGSGASIGANATIVCGNELGRHCMVGAGSVVTHDVPDHALVAGVPARVVGWVCTCGKRLGDDLACVACGRHFEGNDAGGLVEADT